MDRSTDASRRAEANRRRRQEPPLRPVPVGTRQGTPDFSEEARLRAEKRRKHRRHVLVVFYVFLFLAVLGTAVALSLTVLFRITAVEVTGSSRYSQQQIVEASGIQTGDNLFLTKTGEASQKICRALPYLGTAKVTRKFPTGIRIEVAEESVWGAVLDGSRYLILGENGKVMEITPSLPAGCAELRGLAVSSAEPGAEAEFTDSSQISLFREVLSALEASGIGSITEVDFSRPARILVVYDGRVTINLGEPTDLDYKLKFAVKLLSENIKDTEKGTLDMSVVSNTNKAYFDPEYAGSSAAASGNSSGAAAESAVSAPESAASAPESASSSASG